jgi:hypothetical protein
LPNNIKQTGNNNRFKKELKDLLIKRCYYSIDEYLNEKICNIATEKQWYRKSHISIKFIPYSLLYSDNNTDGHVPYQLILIYRTNNIRQGSYKLQNQNA